MIRWLVFSIAVVAIAAFATVGATYFVPDTPETHVVAPQQGKPTGPTGAVEVAGGKTTFDFGIMSQLTEGKHEWTIVNKGSGAVKLSNGGETCSCTNGSIPKGQPVTLEPGQTFNMVVTWNTKTWDKFHQVATVLVSNDPATPKLEFVIDGVPKPPILAAPAAESRIDFQTVGNDKPHSNMIGIASFDRPDTKVTGVKANPDLFASEVRPMTEEECKSLKVEKGNKVILTLKTGAPLGPFHEELIVQTDHPKKPEVRYVVAGKVEGPIRFSPDRVRLFIPAKDGGHESLTLWVQGQKETKFTVEKKPEHLDVQIAPLASVGDATQYRFTVTVPPGQPAGTHYDDTIILKTDHPKATEVKIPVAVTVLRAS
jgi:hypothetical protein